MVSLPTYDNNLFARGISNAEYQALIEDPNRPLVNFALSEQYPPGSTYKLVTGVGALEDGLITPTTPARDGAVPRDRDATSTGSGTGRGFGPLDIYEGFAHSSDTYFYQLAGGLGADRLATGRTSSVSAQRTGIDLPAEARGIVPTNEWKQDVFGQDVFPGEVYQAGIGQGYDTGTPLQVLNAYNALANGGWLYKPQIVRRVLAPDGTVVRDFQPELIQDARRRSGDAARHALRGARGRDQPAHLQPRRSAARRRRQDRHRRVRHSRRAEPAAVPLLVRRLRAGLRPMVDWAIRPRPTPSWPSSPSPTTRTPRATPRPRSSSTSSRSTTTWAST